MEKRRSLTCHMAQISHVKRKRRTNSNIIRGQTPVLLRSWIIMYMYRKEKKKKNMKQPHILIWFADPISRIPCGNGTAVTVELMSLIQRHQTRCMLCRINPALTAPSNTAHSSNHDDFQLQRRIVDSSYSSSV